MLEMGRGTGCWRKEKSQTLKLFQTTWRDVFKLSYLNFYLYIFILWLMYISIYEEEMIHKGSSVAQAV
jgi:hypothetical protein